MMTKPIKIKGNITAPEGILAGGIHCGIKSDDKNDLALIYSEKICNACGMFTKNKIKSTSILVTKNHLKNNKLQAILVISGIANTSTGEKAINETIKIAEALAGKLNIKTQDVAICSTGAIGKLLPTDKIISNLDKLVQNIGRESKNSKSAALAILTTDTKPKEVACKIMLDKPVKIGGIAKGAGMIHPDLATMLVFITTDCNITPGLLKKAFRACVDATFNRLTVDGCTSTNDSVILIANGLANNNKIITEDAAFSAFQSGLFYVCDKLAKMLLEDGEGVSKIVEIEVVGAESVESAKKVAYAIANSILIKADLSDEYISHPGRFLQTIGSCKVKIIPSLIDVYLDDRLIIKNGVVMSFDRYRLKKIVKIKVDLKISNKTISIFTTDLSPHYIRLNK